ncbi:Small RNA degrading nuclease 3 [Hibiscus syriacus]|uniref:Small RNA degrading nuclease 3 n=1 Tax=Hibiscus syriacus TaxID=106335 RepID=A0A6A3AB86_HIBSY|nr:small RNA degrading nuclease 3-like [Hibiscus syriacus]KAE8701193.1 Small RNA degrading nuclease 3 [Hibiscus syriacus]
MDEKLEKAEKKVLVEIVKLVQKRGLEGTQGGWKDFLRSYDKKFGASLSDPSRRTNDVLVSFLKTFTKEDDLKLFSIVFQSLSNRNIVEQFRKQSWDNESPEQSLVRLTLEHPQYPLDYAFPTVDEGWIVTKPPKRSRAMKSNAMIAVDCEMVLCEDGTEALVRVCVVDHDLQVKIDEHVKPTKAVADYRSEITGVTAGDLNGVTCSVADIQKSMMKLLSGGTILVGHSLHNDLQVLKINHARVIDTSYIFKILDVPIYRKPSLNNLCKSVLGYEVRKPGAAHNCLDDACAAMKLVLAKLERGEITLVLDAPEPEREKLLLHRIPVNVRREEISKVIPGAVAIEPKPSKTPQGRHYSAFAVFDSPPEASKAYENMEGDEEKDSSGLPQKLVNFQFGNGKTARIYIRKMAQDHSHREFSSNKRALDGEEKLVKSKKLKTDEETTHANSDTEIPSDERAKESTESKKVETDGKMVEEMRESTNKLDEHLKEIERLKQEVKEKDAKIVLQEKMISNLVKKVDEMKKGPKRKK